MRLLVLPLALGALSAVSYLSPPVPAQTPACTDICYCTWVHRYVWCGESSGCTDSLEAILDLGYTDCEIQGGASVNRFEQGMFPSRPVTGTVTQDSVFLEVEINDPGDPENLLYRLEIVDIVTLQGVFGFLGDGEPTLPVTLYGTDLPVEPATWGQIKTRYTESER